MAKVLDHLPDLDPQQREASLRYFQAKMHRNPVWLRLLSWIGMLAFFGSLGLAR
jgi:hypothetical protein